VEGLIDTNFNQNLDSWPFVYLSSNRYRAYLSSGEYFGG
jgi:hypothetical protein